MERKRREAAIESGATSCYSQRRRHRPKYEMRACCQANSGNSDLATADCTRRAYGSKFIYSTAHDRDAVWFPQAMQISDSEASVRNCLPLWIPFCSWSTRSIRDSKTEISNRTVQGTILHRQARKTRPSLGQEALRPRAKATRIPRIDRYV